MAEMDHNHRPNDALVFVEVQRSHVRDVVVSLFEFLLSVMQRIDRNEVDISISTQSLLKCAKKLYERRFVVSS